MNNGFGKVTGSSGNAGGESRDITLGIFGLEYCTSKNRIIYAQKKLKKDDQKVLNECLESIDFTCGDELLPDNNNYKSLRENKVSVDRRKNCSHELHSLEGHYYKKFDPVCFFCTTPLNPEETKLFQKWKKEYSSVIPCCKNESCIKKNLKFESGKYSGWICKRKRGSLLNQKEEKKKRKAQHDIAQERVNKRRKKIPIPKN